MSCSNTGDAFSGSVTEVYDRLLVPMIFDPYAAAVSHMLSDVRAGSLLEVAAGSGSATRALAVMMSPQISITATDLSQAMLERAIEAGAARPVHWQEADVMDLPFRDASFDIVVCQFGAMFLEPKAAAFAEVRRVLSPGGRFIFSVWNDIEANEFALEVTRSLAELFRDDPPRFLERIPHGYHHRESIMGDLNAAGFAVTPQFVDTPLTSRASSAYDVATAYCMGTPLRYEIEQRCERGLNEAVSFVGASIARRFGEGRIEGTLSAKFVSLWK